MAGFGLDELQRPGTLACEVYSTQDMLARQVDSFSVPPLDSNQPWKRGRADIISMYPTREHEVAEKNYPSNL